MLQSVFLSYGGPDTEFANRLRKDLTRNGVKTWFFPKDAVPGARLQRHLQTQINEYDRMILCCSEASLQREGVLHEVEEVLEREQDEGGTEVMIPVLLDPIFDAGRTPPPWWPKDKGHIYLSLRRRVAADFRLAEDDPDRWREQLGSVLVALRENPSVPVVSRTQVARAEPIELPAVGTTLAMPTFGLLMAVGSLALSMFALSVAFLREPSVVFSREPSVVAQGLLHAQSAGSCPEPTPAVPSTTASPPRMRELPTTVEHVPATVQEVHDLTEHVAPGAATVDSIPDNAEPPVPAPDPLSWEFPTVGLMVPDNAVALSEPMPPVNPEIARAAAASAAAVHKKARNKEARNKKTGAATADSMPDNAEPLVPAPAPLSWEFPTVGLMVPDNAVALPEPVLPVNPETARAAAASAAGVNKKKRNKKKRNKKKRNKKKRNKKKTTRTWAKPVDPFGARPL